MAARTTTRETRRPARAAREVPPAVAVPADDPTTRGRLTALHIRGLGAIDDVTLELGDGLTVVTG